MDEPEFRSRIDEHMARGNEHMARGNELMARGEKIMDEIREEVRLTREVHGRIEAEFQTNREFMRELTLRAERTAREVSAELRASTAQLLDRRRDTDDLREGSRAHTRALLRVLDRMDRLDPGGSGAAA